MASEIRVNSITNRSGLGTVTFSDTGVVLSGVSTFSTGIVVAAGSASAPSISPSGDSNTGIFFPAADTVCISEGGSEVIRVNSSGLVGIGSDSPTAPLNVVNNNASTPTVWLRNTSGGGDSPVLRVQGGANNDNVVGTFEVRDYDGNVDFKVGGTGNVTIGTGNLGIGTAVPSQKLEVVGGEIKAGRVDSTNEGGQVSFGRATDNATGWYIDVYGNTSTPSLRVVDVSNAAVRATFDNSGNLSIANGNLVFSTSGKGIDFSATANSSGTMTSELLSDYEEGTWTPTFSATGASFTYNQQLGTYIKIGNTVFVTCMISPASITGASGVQLFVNGLPFAPKFVNSQNIFGVNIARTNGWVTAPVGGQFFPTTIELYKYSGTNMVDLLCNDVNNGCIVRFNGFYEV